MLAWVGSAQTGSVIATRMSVVQDMLIQYSCSTRTVTDQPYSVAHVGDLRDFHCASGVNFTDMSRREKHNKSHWV